MPTCTICNKDFNGPPTRVMCDDGNCRNGRNGLTLKDIQKLSDEQGGCCAISGIKFISSKTGDYLDPTTGRTLTQSGKDYSYVDKNQGVTKVDSHDIYHDKASDIYRAISTMKRAAIDHCHKSGKIRGLLIQKVNWLIDEFDKRTYGKLPHPKELSDYINQPPAKKIGLDKIHRKIHTKPN